MIRNGAVKERVPAVLTLGNLLLGFTAILSVTQDRFWVAFWLIFIAGLLDGLDGRVARMTGTSSPMGGQLDSLCDTVSFAVAPALLAFQIGLGELGRLGWAACSFFVACGVIRLARFHSSPRKDGDFTGLPIPAAGGAASLPALMNAGEPLPASWVAPYALVLITLSLLMVSWLRYPSFKRLPGGAPRYRRIALSTLLVLLMIAAAEVVIPILAFLYLVFPLLRRLFGARRSGGGKPATHSGSAD